MAQVWAPFTFYLNGEISHCGVNSFQLFFDGERWWIMSILWEQETPQNPIPAELLGQRD